MNVPPKYRPLLIASAALIALPFVLLAVGLTLTTATDVVIFAIACMGLNILVGHTGLVSFGHGAFFGLAAYAAALLVGVVRGLTIYFEPAASEASMYLLMVLVLLFRPRGLFGERIQKFE